MLLSHSYIPVLLSFTADARSRSTFSTLFHGACFSSFREFFLSISSPYHKTVIPLKLLPTVWWHQCQNEASSSQHPRPPTFRSSPIPVPITAALQPKRRLTVPQSLFSINLPSFPDSLTVSPPLRRSLNPA